MAEFMKPYKVEFIEFALSREVLAFGTFTLKSGRESPYFFNFGKFQTGKDLAVLGKLYAAALVDAGVKHDMIFGPAYKGIPIAVATAMSLSEHHDVDTPYCFNRKEAKSHGEGGSIVGHPLKGDVMCVDDVITAGTAIRESKQIIDACGASLAGVLVCLDRQERGQTGRRSAIQEVQADFGCPVVSIICMNDIIQYLEGQPEKATFLEAMRAYRTKYGAEAEAP